MYTIETENLTKYYGNTRGIENVNLTIKEGEIFGFIGPNGAGKSTTIRTLLNLIFPTSGKATVLGLDIIQDSRKIKQYIGYLPAEVGYYDDMTVRELLEYSARFYDSKEHRISELSERFDLDLSRKIEDLSLGNKKKVGIVQALLHKPKLLILDEPTSGLDPLMQKTFFEILKAENKQGTTIFFSSHNLSEVQRLCHRVGIIKNGTILQIEEMEALRSRLFKKIRISGEIHDLDLKGILHVETKDNGTQEFLFNGDINQLIQKLSKTQIDNLWIEEPTLEEVFIHYYEKEEDQHEHN